MKKIIGSFIFCFVLTAAIGAIEKADLVGSWRLNYTHFIGENRISGVIFSFNDDTEIPGIDTGIRYKTIDISEAGFLIAKLVNGEILNYIFELEQQPAYTPHDTVLVMKSPSDRLTRYFYLHMKDGILQFSYYAVILDRYSDYRLVYYQGTLEPLE